MPAQVGWRSSDRSQRRRVRRPSGARSDVLCQEGGVLPYTEQQTGAPAGEPRQPEEIQPLEPGHTPGLDRIAVRIHDRKLHQAEVEYVACGPQDRANSMRAQIQCSDLRLLISVAQPGQRFLRRGPPRAYD